MKNCLLIFLILFTQIVFSQGKDNNVLTVEIDEIDIKPEFPGGVVKMYDFIGENFKMTENKEGIKGKISVSFFVETDGSITDIKIIRDIGHGTGDEVIRVVKMFPKWKSGEKKGEKIRAQYIMPIVIN